MSTTTTAQTAAQTASIELKKRIAGYFIGGVSLVAALGWNDAIKKYISKVYSPKDSANAALYYALIVTLFLVLVVTLVTHLNWNQASSATPQSSSGSIS